MNQRDLGQWLGFERGGDPKANWASMNRFWSGNPGDAECRKAALRHMASQSMEFNEQNVEAGYRYT